MNSIQAPTILFSVYREDAVTNAGVGWVLGGLAGRLLVERMKMK